jgi:hypothetical protein
MLDINSNLAAVCLKELTHFGPESAAMAAKIKQEWLPRVSAFLDDMFKEAFDFVDDIYRPRQAEAVVRRHELEMTENFVSAVGQTIEDYAALAFEDAAFDTTLKFKDSKVAKLSVLERLSQVTGASQVNVARTVNRWFKTTHGMYFARFIMPYTERLTAMRESQGKKATLYDIGQKYKKFAEADGYWDSITDFSAATASVFGQVEAMFALGYQGLVVEAQLDRNCCPVCEAMDGATWPIFEARAQMYDMLIMGAEEAAQAFPWPRSVTGKQPHRLPAYHLRCRCVVQPISISADNKMIPRDVRNLKDKVLGIMGASNTRVVRHGEGCVNKVQKAYDQPCIRYEMGLLRDNQRQYEGESAVRDVLGLGALKFTNSRSPVDMRTSSSAIDVYTIRNRSDRVPGGSSKGKTTYCETHNLQPWTVVLVEGEAMSYEVYAYEGFDVDFVEDTAFLGDVSREQGETESGEAFDDYFREFLGENL